MRNMVLYRLCCEQEHPTNTKVNVMLAVNFDYSTIKYEVILFIQG